MSKTTKALLVGCGKMGQALLKGWLKHSVFKQVAVVDPSDKPSDPDFSNIDFYKDISNIAFTPDLIVLAIKPQVMDESLKGYQSFDQALFLSIAAGKTTKNISDVLGDDRRIVRVMPNTPAAIGQGVSVLFAGDKATKEDQMISEKALAVCGDVHWVEDEDLMHAVTALSGSGPAYVFHLIEALAKAGMEAGLDDQLSMELARQTVIGSAALAKDQSQVDVAELRKAVTSPGGTTEAALEILMEQSPTLTELFIKAIKTAQSRSIQLSSS